MLVEAVHPQHVKLEACPTLEGTCVAGTKSFLELSVHNDICTTTLQLHACICSILHIILCTTECTACTILRKWRAESFFFLSPTVHLYYVLHAFQNKRNRGSVHDHLG